jgi:hypothetical protein
MTRRSGTGRVLAVAQSGRAGEAVHAVARAVAELVDARVSEFEHGGRVLGPGDADAVLAALDDRAVRIGVLSAADTPELTWPVLQRVAKPVVVAPSTAWDPHRIGRALIPLDGTPEAAGAVTPTNRLLGRAGVDLLVLHVFHPDSVPPYWDQHGHADQVWQQEFRARFCDLPGARLRWRSGVIGDQVLDVAVAEEVDLIALGWSQHLEPGRARTVRQTLRRSPVPVLLVPVASQDLRPSSAARGGR